MHAKTTARSPDEKMRLAFKFVVLLLAALTLETAVLGRLWYSSRRGARPAGAQVSKENAIVVAYPNVDFTKFYSGMSASEIDQLQRECLSVRNVYSPFVEFRPLPATNRFVTVTSAGFRAGRAPQPWPPAKSDLVVFVFGGSTTWGFGVRDSETPVAALEQELATRYPGRKVQCYNFGVCYYFSTQERLLLERLLQGGTVPNLAIFIDGLNDFHYASGQPALTERLSQCLEPELPSALPLDLSSEGARAAAVAEIIRRYGHHVRLTRAMADAYGVETIFIGQPVPFYDYPVPPERSPFHDRMSDHWLSYWGYRRFETAARQGQFGTNFVWCGDAFMNAAPTMYVDSTHYSAAAAVVLAKAIVARAGERNLLPR